MIKSSNYSIQEEPMPTICPNCQNPVRTGAKYCGFCGTSLMMTGEVETAPPAALQEQAGIQKAARKDQSGSHDYRHHTVIPDHYAVIGDSPLVRHQPLDKPDPAWNKYALDHILNHAAGGQPANIA
jgi:hypothetical protein